MDDENHVSIESDADIVTARQLGRTMALSAGFSTTDATLVATAISEVARNIVRYAGKGMVSISAVKASGRDGLLVVARDEGPGIAQVSLAMRDGYSTANSLGLGLPGAKRLMDEFEIVSEVGKGTTITMRKWCR